MDCDSQETYYWISVELRSGTALSPRQTLLPLQPWQPLRPSAYHLHLGRMSPRPAKETATRAQHQPLQHRLPRPTHGKYLPSSAMSRMTASSTRRWAPQEAKGGTLPSQVRNRDNTVPSFTMEWTGCSEVKDRLLYWLTEWQVDRLIYWSTDRTNDYWLTDWLIYWKTDWLTNQ